MPLMQAEANSTTVRVEDYYFRIEEVMKGLQETIHPMRDCTVQKVLEAIAPDFVIIAYRK